ncbi:hypothetical protein [Pseudooceanicola sp. LIPI14-2-Ac024]|uniref:hypothetical protein n=1 Tax=Pseudooceanicola sp. LIPI14-2-Ac024 TaxID=3344875 RepID=UPI0035CECD8B
MISARPDTGEMLSRLETAAALPGIPAGAAKRCALLIERLQRPVRLGLFGFPGAGKSLLMNALAGEVVIPEGLILPTLEIAHGASPQMQVTRADGTVVTRAGRLDAAVLDDDPIFIRVILPVAALKGRSVLMLAAGAAPDELGPALTWAAARCDIALWCSRNWSAAEQAIWARAPEGLKNHAMLVLSRDHAEGAHDRAEWAAGFDRVFRITPLRLVRESHMTAVRPAAGLDALLAHVRQVIDDGRSEDLDAATILLHRFEQRSRVRSRPLTEPVQPIAPVPPRTAEVAPAPAVEPEVAPEEPPHPHCPSPRRPLPSRPPCLRPGTSRPRPTRPCPAGSRSSGRAPTRWPASCPRARWPRTPPPRCWARSRPRCRRFSTSSRTRTSWARAGPISTTRFWPRRKCRCCCVSRAAPTRPGKRRRSSSRSGARSKWLWRDRNGTQRPGSAQARPRQSR